MRAVSLIRVSDLSQVEGHSLDAQERLFFELCKSREWEAVRVYREEGKSAHVDAIAKRPVFRQLLHDAQEHQFDIVVVHTLDRWARNLRVQLEALAMLTKMSALVLLPIGFAAVTLGERPGNRSLRPLRLAVAGVIVLLSIWACYRFSVGPILQPGDRVDLAVRAVFGSLPQAEQHVREALQHVPAPEYWMGLRQLISRNEDGNVSYFLGQVQTSNRPKPDD